MTVFLAYISLILIIISIGYLFRIYLITKNQNGKRTADAIEKEKRLTRKVMLILLIIFMLSVIFNYYYYNGSVLF